MVVVVDGSKLDNSVVVPVVDGVDGSVLGNSVVVVVRASKLGTSVLVLVVWASEFCASDVVAASSTTMLY